jgi:hypothetical protein
MVGGGARDLVAGVPPAFSPCPSPHIPLPNPHIVLSGSQVELGKEIIGIRACFLGFILKQFNISNN